MNWNMTENWNSAGATRSPEATEVLYARQHFVTVCKAFRLQAIDLVYINFKDAEGLERQSLEGARMVNLKAHANRVGQS
jgi:citrate lyase subunit beta-like protein